MTLQAETAITTPQRTNAFYIQSPKLQTAFSGTPCEASPAEEMRCVLDVAVHANAARAAAMGPLVSSGIQPTRWLPYWGPAA